MKEWPDLPARRRDAFLRRIDKFLKENKKNIDSTIITLESERKE